MKLTIERKELLAALGIVKSVAADGRAQASSPPILSHVHINTFDKSVEFICTDLDLVLRARVDAEIKTKGSTTVRAGLLHDLARSFAGDYVELELTKDTLHVTCGKSRYKLGAFGAFNDSLDVISARLRECRSPNWVFRFSAPLWPTVFI